MKKLHLVMQPKGGAGKSFCACHLIQYLEANEQTYQGFDIDASNNTLSQFSALQVEIVDLFDEDEDDPKVDSTKFDTNFMDKLYEVSESNIIVDIGASVMTEFSYYLSEMNFFDFIVDEGFYPIVHCPIAGGTNFIDNLGGLKKIYDAIGSAASYLVWRNPYFGKLQHEGIDLEDTKLIRAINKQLIGIVNIPKVTSDPLTKNITDMMSQKLTYNEIFAPTSTLFKKYEESRLKKYQVHFYESLDIANILSFAPYSES